MSPSLLWPRIVFGVLMVVVTFLTLTPNPVESEPGFALTRWISSLLLGDAENADKIGHFLAYAVLGVTAFWARLAIFSKRWSVVIALAFYGAALEGLQGLGGVRSPELADAFANSLGAVSGFLAGAALGWFRKKAAS
ncbi:VanZ family protein [Hyphococcus flavus]|uniref:VanZ family protein n=1 Tax=Hyphococcus flavus TaxID=1866326 RepID=A0AAF0CB63_9PROT|nr:VanZ family protein [Hyphococcus flavus]WDI30070.1 VanZ family protein [Hyphococcus flavus]